MAHTAELHDIGHKPSKLEVAGPSSPPKVWYPTLNIEADIPGLEQLSMGKTVRGCIEFKIVGYRKRDGQPPSIELEVRKLGEVYAVGKTKGEGTLANAMSQKEYARA